MTTLGRPPKRISAFEFHNRQNNTSQRAEVTSATAPVAREEVNIAPLVEMNENKPKRGRKRKIQQKPDSSEQNVENVRRDSSGNESSAIPNPPEEETAPAINQPNVAPCGNQTAEETFKWLIHPQSPDIFSDMVMDKKPYHLPRGNENYYKGLFSCDDFNRIIKENNLEYGREIDVVAYVDDERRTTTNEMKVHPSFVWKCYKEGNSIRMRNPQNYHRELWKICALLQEYLGSVVGVNMYLTPPNSQGFPPHYDDIDAFILQIEGSKVWRLYKPRNEQVLARFPSADLKEDELADASMEVEINQGDMLYFPRGYIHQAITTEDVHSLHLTFSCNQLNTFGDLLLLGVTHAVEQAIKNDVQYRKSLPKDYMNLVGASNTDRQSDERKRFMQKYSDFAQNAMKYLSVDHAADLHCANFIHGSLPPFFDKNEKMRSIHGNGCRLQNDEILDVVNLTTETKIRWIRKRTLRLVMDEDGTKLFYSLGNSKNCKENEALFMEIDSDAVPAINFLFQSHPDYVKVSDLPADVSFQLQLAQQLYDNGFLMTEEPLAPEEVENVESG